VFLTEIFVGYMMVYVLLCTYIYIIIIEIYPVGEYMWINRRNQWNPEFSW
jgi:hypothetical protein